MSFDLPSFRFDRKNIAKGTYEVLAHGSDAMGPHERIMIHRQKMEALSVVAAYTASVLFAVVAGLLIVLAPESRAVAANIVAAALLLLAAGIAGFTRFSAKGHGVEVRAETPKNSN